MIDVSTFTTLSQLQNSLFCTNSMIFSLARALRKLTYSNKYRQFTKGPSPARKGRICAKIGVLQLAPLFITMTISVLVGNLALVLPLFLWNRSEANNGRRAITSIISAINEEMKDFHGEMKVLHGKLCSLEQQQAKAVMDRLLKIQAPQ